MACIGALRAAGQDGNRILIVDDASTDGAAKQAAERYGTNYLELSRGPQGPAVARNAGAREAGSVDAYLFVDADVCVHPSTLEGFKAGLMQYPEVDAAFGSYDDDPPATGWISRYKNLLHHYMHQQADRDATTFWSGCGVIRQAAFQSVGGFEHAFSAPSIEDIELGVRLVEAGFRIEVWPHLLCTHLKRWTLGSWLTTDIFQRALPWCRLILAKGGRVPATLNLGYRERVTAGVVCLLVLSLLSVPFVGTMALGLSALCAVGFVLLQCRLLLFFARCGGIRFASAAALMHVVYYLYSCATYAYVMASAAVGDRTSAGDIDP